MKRLFLLVALMMMGATAHAQIKFGIQAGANFTDVPLSMKDLKSNSKTGFRVGPMAEFSLPLVPVAFDAALLYVTNGADFEKDGKKEEFNIGYLEIPVYAKYRFGMIPAVDFTLIGGGYFGLKVNDNSDAISYLKGDGLQSEKTTYGLNAGVGIEFINRIQLMALWAMPLSEDYKFKGIANTSKDFYSAKNKVFSLSAAILF